MGIEPIIKYLNVHGVCTCFQEMIRHNVNKRSHVRFHVPMDDLMVHGRSLGTCARSEGLMYTLL